MNECKHNFKPLSYEVKGNQYQDSTRIETVIKVCTDCSTIKAPWYIKRVGEN